MQDRNFDDIAEKFSRNIYGTTKGQLRQAILWQDLDRVLAEMGPQNCVCWMLAAEKGRPQSKWPSAGIRSFMRSFCADDRPRKTGGRSKGVSDNMQFIHCAAQDVASHLETPVDLILFHAVLSGWPIPAAYYRPCGQCCVQAAYCR